MNKIAVFVKNLSSGGAEKQSVLLAKNLATDFQVHYIIFDASIVHQKYIDMLNENEKISIVMFHGNIIRRFYNLVHYLRKNKIDSIFSYLTAANFYASLTGIFLKIKVYTGLRNARLPLLKQIADKLLTNYFADLTISNSFSGKNHFEKHGFKKNKIIVIPNCFSNIKPYKEKDKSNTIHIITVGRFVSQKDYETAIQSIALTRKRCPNIIFDIVGYGKLEAQIREWIKIYKIEDITHIYINPNNIDELLEKANIYLSTSIFEGTSNSIMEGMNANLPIVATKVGDNDQLISHNINGFLCNIKETDTISKYLIKLTLSEETRRKMGNSSKEILQAKFSESIFKKRYLDILTPSQVQVNPK